ncbi:MAG: hypothetical protein ACR2RD_07185 [Woeseiaceae bacterium]
MNKGKVNIITVLMTIFVLTGCSTISAQQLSEKYDRPILSASEAKSMISVEVKPLAPAIGEHTVAALTD